MKRWAGLTAGVFLAWNLYLVPTAALLDVGYGTDGFRRFGQRYASVRVIEVTPRAAVKVRAALPPGAVVALHTQQGKTVRITGEATSEVEALQEWSFQLPDGDAPGNLAVLLDHEEYRWTLTPRVQFQSFPWWFRLAPPWAKRWHMEHVGLKAGVYRVTDFTPIGQGPHSGIHHREAVLITDRGAWEAHWLSHSAGQVPAPGVPDTDFTQESVIAVHAGEYPSGGHSVEVTGVHLSGDTLQAKVRIRKTISGATAVLTHPFQFIRIPAVSPAIKLVIQW